MNTKLLTTSLRNVLVTAIYIFAVSQIMYRGDQWFGKLDNNFLGPFALLLLFSASAAIVGGLVFGQSIQLFLEGKKRESIEAAIFSVILLFIITLIVFIFLVAS